MGPTEWRQAELNGPRLPPQPAEGCCEWQLWSYSPALVRGTPIVDPLSPTLSLEQGADERVQMALDTKFGEMKPSPASRQYSSDGGFCRGLPHNSG